MDGEGEDYTSSSFVLASHVLYDRQEQHEYLEKTKDEVCTDDLTTLVTGLTRTHPRAMPR